MATIVKGPRKGETVKIMEIRGEFALLDDSCRIRLGCLQVNHWERKRIIQNYTEDDTFGVFYDFGWFLKTNRFKKISWARV